MKYIIFTLVSILFAVKGLNLIQEFIESNNFLASSLYKQISKTTPGNFLVSPFSAEVSLSELLRGTKGSTSEELRAALFLPEDRELFVPIAVEFVLSELGGKRYNLGFINKLLVNEKCKVRKEFEHLTNFVFFGEVLSLDFFKNVSRMMNNIDLPSPSELNGNSSASLVNAFFLQGSWYVPFNVYHTIDKKFYENGSSVVKMVSTMHSVNNVYEYFEDKQLKAIFLRMPLENEMLTMTFILPYERNGLSRLERQIERVLEEKRFQQEVVNVHLPKFKIDSLLDLDEFLKMMGVKKIFENGVSDDNLKLDKIIQKTSLSVNEFGIDVTSSINTDFTHQTGPLKNFQADHPFIFTVKVKDLVIFVGRVVSPEF